MGHVVLPSCRVFDSYTTEYKRLKGLRTLEWKNYLGQVEVEVEVGDRTLSLSVSPPRAVIVYLFQEKGEGCMYGSSAVYVRTYTHHKYNGLACRHATSIVHVNTI